MRAEYLEAADEIGSKLCRNSIWSGNRCNWIGPSMEFVEGDWRPVYRACAGTIYHGTSGIALFLQKLYEITEVAEYRRCANGALEHALSRTSEIPLTCRGGFYSGLTGTAYAAFDLGRTDTALTLLRGLAAEDVADHDLDVISGSAGAIPVFLALHARCGENFLLDLAIRHAEHLLRSARHDGDALSWNTLRATAGRDLTGFSHGTSGIAWGLLELFAKTGEADYRGAALKGLAYERRWFNREHGNWPDFRTQNERNPPGSGEPSYGIAWCHGAPGIGLSRLRAYQILGESWCREEAEIALRTTGPFCVEPAIHSHNFSLCHGVCGNSELPLAAGAREITEQVARYGIEAYRKKRMPWPCGVAQAGETPSLMLGTAGIGYFYLRLFDQLKVPSMLLFEQPRAASQ